MDKARFGALYVLRQPKTQEELDSHREATNHLSRFTRQFSSEAYLFLSPTSALLDEKVFEASEYVIELWTFTLLKYPEVNEPSQNELYRMLHAHGVPINYILGATQTGAAHAHTDLMMEVDTLVRGLHQDHSFFVTANDVPAAFATPAQAHASLMMAKAEVERLTKLMLDLSAGDSSQIATMFGVANMVPHGPFA